MTRLLLDQGLPLSTTRHLAEQGINSTHVSDIGMSTASDQMILNHAQVINATVVTLDSDFHQLLALNRAIEPSVIRIRIEGLRGLGIAKLIKQVVLTAALEISKGAAITVTERGIRIRKLPLA